MYVFEICPPPGNRRKHRCLLYVLAKTSYFDFDDFTLSGKGLKFNAFPQNENIEKTIGFYSIFELRGSLNSGPKTRF